MEKKRRQCFGDRESFLKWTLFALALLLLVDQVYHTLHYPIWRDDAFFAIVAKNLVSGAGYKAVFFNESYAFSHGISVGPVVILPAAALIFLCGNQYWVPGVANILLIWSLLIAVFILADGLLGKGKKWPFCFLALLFTLIFSIGEYGNENSDFLILWHLLMGEIPAALCVIAGAFLLFCHQSSFKKMLVGGLFLGFAIMAKTITGIAVGVIVSAFILQKSRDKNLQKLQQIRLIISVIACVVAPFFLFELTKIILLGWERYLEIQSGVIEMYKHNAAIVTSRESNGIQVSTDVKKHVVLLSNFFGPAKFLFLPSTIYIFYLANRDKNKESSSSVHAGLVLILCALIHVMWWMRFTYGSERYIVVALVCYFVGLSLLLVNIDYKKRSRLQVGIIVLFVFLLLHSRDKEIGYLFYNGFQGNDKKLQEQIVVAQTIKNLEQQGVAMISCGNNFELEYLLPGVGNFKKCETILKDSANAPTMLVNYFLDSAKSNLILAVDYDQYYALSKAVPTEISSRCDHEYLKTKNSSLNWCRQK